MDRKYTITTEVVDAIVRDTLKHDLKHLKAMRKQKQHPQDREDGEEYINALEILGTYYGY